MLDRDRMATLVADRLDAIRERKPLVHHITNMVVMNETANATLAIGALPVMAHAREEVAEMVGIAGALVLNIGTLTPELIGTMIVAGRRANELGTPIVLDPVGAGATRLRTDSAARLLAELKVAIVRGNAGEIGVVAGVGGEVRGVESMGAKGDLVEVGRRLARLHSTTAAISGKRDVIVDARRVGYCDNGHILLTTITGTGCVATTIVAAFAAVEPDPLLAATAGYVALGIAGEVAATKASGPGSFQPALFDALYALDRPTIVERCRAWIEG
jgi:hydroxyethylthiazole kinase